MEKIKNFVESWKKRGYEKGESHSFWLAFLRDVLNVDKPENFIDFEVPVKLKHKSFIDAFLPDTKIIIEQKSSSVNLEKNQTQSDGEILSPYEQAQRYGNSLPYSMRPRWIVVCNFQEFLIYDMELMSEPTKILLEELPEKFSVFDFMIDANKNKIRLEVELSLKAGEIVGKLYGALKKNYLNPNSEESLQSLNKLCVRLVFCLYAESSGIFGKRKIFRDYLSGSRNIRQDLILLFDVLNTPEKNRDPYLADELKIFPYVNGGLFADEKIEIPNFTTEIKNLLLDEASSSFNWSGISPTIFGAVFESTLNPVTRREGGMHYTSIENIHKVIDPLFLDDLREEFLQIKNFSRNKKKKLLDFQRKLSELKFFDPACGSGNFLTESFISLRRLENEILKKLLGEKILLGELDNPIKISINQFYGVEINDFAVSVAQTALWIAELQMLQETQEIIHKNLNPLPLKNFANIFEGNALRMDWTKILPPDINFIFGNPPFVGTKYQTSEQKADILSVCKDLKPLDYVTSWYFKASQFMENNSVRSAFVSTNSITQGEQVAPLWKILNAHIDFAHRTFKWDSESNDKAAVHCVIIGFSVAPNPKPKIIFDGEQKIFAENINGYLQDAPNVYIEKRKLPLCNVPKISDGNIPADGGNLILSEDEKNTLLEKFPVAEKFIRSLLGGEEFLHNKKRYCLWLVGANPSEIKKISPIYERVQAVRNFRLQSKKLATQKDAERSTEFQEIRQPTEQFILIPKVSSENRVYIPIGFVNPENIPLNSVRVIQGGTFYHFGILESSVHMAWMRAVCGRMKSDYAYSASIVYNNFIWCQPSENQRKKIEQTAQNILDCRNNYPDASLADLYDPILMPKDLHDAHKKNDRAVMEAYGFDLRMSESEIVGKLMKLYNCYFTENAP